MSAQSLFTRQWWAVCLRAAKAAPGLTPAERLNEVVREIAEGFGGTPLKRSGVYKRGVFVASMAEQVPEGIGESAPSRLSSRPINDTFRSASRMLNQGRFR